MQKKASTSFWDHIIRSGLLILGRPVTHLSDIRDAAVLAHPNLNEDIPASFSRKNYGKLAKSLIEALDAAKNSQAANAWDTLVTQNTVPDLLRTVPGLIEGVATWTGTSEGPPRPRIEWEKSLSLVDANYPDSCIRILGMAAKLGDGGTWATTSDKTGDPLLAAALEASRLGLEQIHEENKCHAINLLHDAARIWLMARRQIGLVSPQAVASMQGAFDARRPAVFFGGTDGAHTGVAAMAQNWIGGFPNVTQAWIFWQLASEVDPDVENVEEFFKLLDLRARIRHPGSTLEAGQTVWPPRPQPRTTPGTQPRRTHPQGTPRTQPPPSEALVEGLQREIVRLTGVLTGERVKVRDLKKAEAEKDALITELQGRTVESIVGGKIKELSDANVVLSWLNADQKMLRIVAKGLRGDGKNFSTGTIGEVLEVRIDEDGELVVDVQKDARDRYKGWKGEGPSTTSGARLLTSPSRVEARFSAGARARVAKRLGGPSMTALTRNLVGAILATAKNPSQGHPVLRNSIQAWASASGGGAEVATHLTTLCDNVLRGEHHLPEPYAGLSVINGYRTNLQTLMREVSVTAFDLKRLAWVDDRGRIEKCMDRAASLGRSIGQEWSEV